MIRLAEKFVSINGEGKKAGETAVFIRFAGCNLTCAYCDTRWALDPNAWQEEMTLDALRAYVQSTGIKNVTLTGGEPLVQEHISEVVKGLVEDGCLVEIETNGSQKINDFDFYDYGNVSFTVDYKLPGSGQEEQMCKANYTLLSLKDAVKFVVSTIADLERAYEVIREFRLNELTTVYLSAAFSEINNQEIVAFMVDQRLNGVKLQLQLHKYVWDPETQGV